MSNCIHWKTVSAIQPLNLVEGPYRDIDNIHPTHCFMSSMYSFVSPGTGTKQLHVCTHEDHVDGRLHDPHLDQGEPLAPWSQAEPSLRSSAITCPIPNWNNLVNQTHP